jgi:hypothetical protein
MDSFLGGEADQQQQQAQVHRSPVSARSYVTFANHKTLAVVLAPSRAASLGVRDGRTFFVVSYTDGTDVRRMYMSSFYTWKSVSCQLLLTSVRQWIPLLHPSTPSQLPGEVPGLRVSCRVSGLQPAVARFNTCPSARVLCYLRRTAYCLLQLLQVLRTPCNTAERCRGGGLAGRGMSRCDAESRMTTYEAAKESF